MGSSCSSTINTAASVVFIYILGTLSQCAGFFIQLSSSVRFSVFFAISLALQMRKWRGQYDGGIIEILYKKYGYIFVFVILEPRLQRDCSVWFISSLFLVCLFLVHISPQWIRLFSVCNSGLPLHLFFFMNLFWSNISQVCSLDVLL